MKTMFKIIGGILVLLGIGAIGNQMNHQPIKQAVPVVQQPLSKPLVTQTSGKNDKEIVLRDVAYGNDKRNTMNVFIPKGASSTTPFILFMHGGAWISGDKNDVAIVQLALGKEGIASAAINYRYASKTVHYTELMNDVNSAVDYIVLHGKDWNVNTEKMAIGGISAGAHMAMLYAYHYDSGNHISSVISLAGPVDLTNVDFLNGATLLKLIDGANKLVGAKYEVGKPVPNQFKDASPIQYVKNVPTLIIHGTSDTIVPFTQSELLADTLSRKKYNYILMNIDGANHDLGLANQTTAKQVTEKMVDWVKGYYAE